MVSRTLCLQSDAYYDENSSECDEALEDNDYRGEDSYNFYRKEVVDNRNPINAVLNNKMFPFIALGAIGVGAYLLFFNKGKNKII